MLIVRHSYRTVRVWQKPVRHLNSTTSFLYLRLLKCTHKLSQKELHCYIKSDKAGQATPLTYSRKRALSETVENSALKRMFYSEYGLDKAEHIRKDESKLKELEESPEAKFVPWNESKCLFTKFENAVETFIPIVLSPFSSYIPFLDKRLGNIFLGLEPETQVPYFAGAVEDKTGFEATLMNEIYAWIPVRSLGDSLKKEDAALVAVVNGLMEFHSNHLFCGKTGVPLISSSGGYCRKPDLEDKTEEKRFTVFPRNDPAMICLVTQGEYCLLGRKPSWKETTRYSCLSGFLEVGETLEQTVEREVFEESGIKVDPSTIEYFGSQPWPFPQSVMIGFRAQALLPQFNTQGLDRLQGDARAAAEETGISGEEVGHYLGVSLPQPTPQPEEMDDVRWFHYTFIRENLDSKSESKNLTIPGDHAIANRIINGWLKEIDASLASWLGNLFPEVIIDEGRFKYILIRLQDDEHSRIIVRGLKGRSYHMNILEEFQAEARRVGFNGNITPLGGGRIEHDASHEEISIYGYSSAFGTAVHDVTAVLCKRAFPFYDKITISYSGY